MLVALPWFVMVTGPDMLIGWLGVVGCGLCIAFVAIFAEHRSWRACAAVAAVPIVALALGMTGIPGKARIAASEQAITEAGDAVRAGKDPDRAGLFGIESSRVDANGCAILVTQFVVFDEYGVAYCPDGVDQDDPYPELFHSIGDIYRYQVNE